MLRLKDIIYLRVPTKVVHTAWLEREAGQREARLQQLAQIRVRRRGTAHAVAQATARVSQLTMHAAQPAVLDQGAAVAAAAAAPDALDADDDVEDEGVNKLRDLALAAQYANEE